MRAALPGFELPSPRPRPLRLLSNPAGAQHPPARPASHAASPTISVRNDHGLDADQITELEQVLVCAAPTGECGPLWRAHTRQLTRGFRRATHSRIRQTKHAAELAKEAEPGDMYVFQLVESAKEFLQKFNISEVRRAGQA